MAYLLLIDDAPDLILERVRQAFPAPRDQVAVVGTGAKGLERVLGLRMSFSSTCVYPISRPDTVNPDR